MLPTCAEFVSGQVSTRGRSRLRVLLALSAAFALSVAFAPPALAAPPDRTPAVAEPITFEAGEVCPFPVSLAPVGDRRQKITTFADGRQIITASFRARVTNEDTGRSIVVNNSGPASITPNPDGTVTVKVTGRSLFYFFPGDLGPGQPGALLYMTGLVVETLPADFSAILSFTHTGGTTENLCETLAGP